VEGEVGGFEKQQGKKDGVPKKGTNPSLSIAGKKKNCCCFLRRI